MFLRLPFFLLLSAIIFPAHAEDEPVVDSLVAADPAWLALLHYNRGATMNSRGATYVDDASFFLSPVGGEDAAAEFRASVEAFREPGSMARCQFPARYRFVAERLGWPDGEGLAHCAELQEWLGQIPDQRVVLVFPASYLNSPSSMFGHTLLRLDDAENPDSVWHSWAVNFGATTSEQDNSIFYIYRGLAGGYPGRFVIVPYARKIQEYSHLENRDIWEYTLDLDSDQIEQLILHLWELREVNFDYYFFDENCSFRLLELIDVVEPGVMMHDGFRLAEAPVSTVRTLFDLDLVRERVYRPSKAAQLEAERRNMDSAQQKMVKQLMNDPALAQSPQFLSYDQQSRHRMALLAYQVQRFKYRKKPRDAQRSAHGLALLKVVNENAFDGEYALAKPTAPEQGHGTQMLSLGGGQVGADDFGELRYRFTYHDLVDRQAGFLRGAQIEGLDLHVRSTESDDLKLETADIVHIRSLSPRNRLIKPVSWFVHGGLERAMAGDRKRLVRFVQGGPGLTWQAGDVMPYGFVTARLENNSAYSSFMEPGAGAQAGFLWYLPRAQINAGGEGHYFANDEYRHRQFLHINVPLSRQSAIRAEWRRDAWRGDNEKGFSLAWRQFFD